MKRIAIIVAAIVISGLGATPALADGGLCQPGGGTQTDCHIYIGGVSTHCKVYRELGGAVSCSQQ